MTNDEANKVVEAFRPFDQFVANAPLNRNWHGTCQQLFTQAIQQIAVLVDKPAVQAGPAKARETQKTPAGKKPDQPKKSR